MIIFPPNQSLPNSGRVKFGIDPTSGRLHLGHLIPILEVKKLQEKNFPVTIVIGDFTARLGDPTGATKTRPILSKEEVDENAEKIIDQLQNILLPNFKIFHNATVFDGWTFNKFLDIAKNLTVEELMERDSFQNRSVGLQEIIVPLCQAYDSVHLKSHIEIGGQDQLINFTITRKLQKSFGLYQQVCIMTDVINGLDGKKMSKSSGNCIFLNDAPNDIFGKAMSISDEIMEEWAGVFGIQKQIHPMETKKSLAFRLTELIYDKRAAEESKNFFEEVFQNKENPNGMVNLFSRNLISAVSELRKCSGSESRRLISSGVKVNGVFIHNDVDLEDGDVLRVGRNFGKIT